MYQTDAYGLFLAQMTLPYGKEEDFIRYEMKELFAAYRRNVMATCGDEESDAKNIFEEFLYQPHFYGLLGSFDLAVLALVDDFSLATRHFHPFNSLIAKGLAQADCDYEASNYIFNVISGICPDLQSMDPAGKSLLDTAQTTFIGDHSKQYPFLGITSVKLNNGLLIGNGGRLMEVALQAVYRTLQAGPGEELAFIIMHSFAWHELTIVFFSDRLETIKDKVFQVRRLHFGELLAAAKTKEQQLVLEEVRKQALLSVRPLPEGKSLAATHLFVHTNTVFGYDLQLLFQPERYQEILHQQGVQLHVRWDVKPGHLPVFLEQVRPFLPAQVAQAPGRITAGRGDFAFLLQQDSMHAYLDMMRQVTQSKVVDHVRKISTIVEFAGLEEHEMEKHFDPEAHYYFHRELGRFRFPTPLLARIRRQLKGLGVPKVLRERVSNMFITYNDGIFDTVLYGYFIELRPFLETTTETIQYLVDHSQDLQEIVFILEGMVKAFEAAYKNRFGQSYIMNEITDINIDFNGGIQQLLVAYDGAYKHLTAFLGEHRARSIAYVAGDTNTISDQLSVSLNYTHLFQPVYFAAAATHEAANFFYRRFGSDLADWHLREIDGETPGPISNAMGYFFTDAVSYFLTFNANFELFFFWHWAYFVQMTLDYDGQGQLNTDKLHEFMARMFMVNDFCNRGGTFFPDEVLPEMIKVKADVRRLWQQSFRPVRKAMYAAATDHHEIITEQLNTVLGLVVEEFAGEATDSNHPGHAKLKKQILQDEALQEAIVYGEDRMMVQREEGPATYRVKQHFGNARFYLIDFVTAEIIQAFNDGKTFSFAHLAKKPRLAHADRTFFYQCLFHAYLKIIFNLCGGQCEVLDRDPETGHVRLTTEKRSPIQFDPMGGTFSVDMECRQQYYQYRVLFLKSLWSLATIHKTNLFASTPA